MLRASYIYLLVKVYSSCRNALPPLQQKVAIFVLQMTKRVSGLLRKLEGEEYIYAGALRF